MAAVMTKRSSSVRAQLAAIVLTFESVIIFLGALTLFGLDEFAGFGLPRWSALVLGGVLLTLTVIAIALLRRGSGYVLGKRSCVSPECSTEQCSLSGCFSA